MKKEPSLSNTGIGIHRVESVEIGSKSVADFFTTDITVIDKDGSRTVITLYSESPIEVKDNK